MMVKGQGNSSFLEKSMVKHKNKYCYYPDEDYSSKSKEVVVFCPHHGDFTASRRAHMEGYGCPVCREKGTHRRFFVNGGERREKDKKPLNKNANLWVYLIELPFPGKNLLKIGIASKMEARLKPFKQTYGAVTTIKTIQLHDRLARNFERYLLQRTVDFTLEFDYPKPMGYTELRNTECQEYLVKLFEAMDVVVNQKKDNS